MKIEIEMLVRNYRIYATMYCITGSKYYNEVAEKFYLIIQMEKELEKNKKDIEPVLKEVTFISEFYDMLETKQDMVDLCEEFENFIDEEEKDLTDTIEFDTLKAA